MFVEIKNIGPKTIKYCTLAFTGVNAVGDVIKVNNNEFAFLKITGPIISGASAENTFEYVWTSDDKVSNAGIVVANVEYMDGSKEVIIGNKINSIPK